MKHFDTMEEAVRYASKRCAGWLVLESGEYIEVDAAAYIARVTDGLDHEEDEEEEMYYLASDEGAVGVTSRYEYLAQWVLIPVFRPMAEIEAEIQEALERQQAQTVQTPAFCPYCGTKQNPGARFCPECGRQFSAN